MVVVDTSAWIEFMKRPDSAIGTEVGLLLSSNQVAMVGVVMVEVLQGLRGQALFDARDGLMSLPFINPNRATWLRTSELSASLRAQGLTTPLSDLLIAIQTLEHDHELLTTDEHFKRVPGLRLHEVASA